VQKARIVDRPTTLDYLHLAFDDFVELHGDRAFADDPAVVGGVASIGGRSVVVIGHEKGHSVRQRVARNFGMPHPEGYRKTLRLLEHAEAFALPVVTLVDTPGAHPGPDAEERGQSHAIAETIMRSSRLRVPIVAVITGEGGSGGALALCTSDRLLVLQNAYLSVISPEGCAAILWRTAASAPTAARAMRLGAAHLYESGIATSVVAEPPGGAHTDPIAAARMVREALLRELEDLSRLDADTLVDARSRRLSRIGGDDAQPLRTLQPVLPVGS
jgi:acetyl-CoA carboxylase carboxyl transferase subunit beta